MKDFTCHIAVLMVTLFIPSAQSLKSKRMVLKSLKDRIRSQFNVSISELDSQDKWQLAVCGMVQIGNDKRYLNSCLENILKFMEHFHDFEINDHEIFFL